MANTIKYISPSYRVLGGLDVGDVFRFQGSKQGAAYMKTSGGAGAYVHLNTGESYVSCGNTEVELLNDIRISRGAN